MGTSMHCRGDQAWPYVAVRKMQSTLCGDVAPHRVASPSATRAQSLVRAMKPAPAASETMQLISQSKATICLARPHAPHPCTACVARSARGADRDAQHLNGILHWRWVRGMAVGAAQRSYASSARLGAIRLHCHCILMNTACCRRVSSRRRMQNMAGCVDADYSLVLRLAVVADKICVMMAGGARPEAQRSHLGAGHRHRHGNARDERRTFWPGHDTRHVHELHPGR